MINPFGSLMVDSHDMLVGSLDGAISASVEMARAPAAALFVIGGIVVAVRLSYDRNANAELLPYLIRSGALLIAACTLDLVNYYARDAVFQAIPAWIVASFAVMSGAVVSAAGIQGAAAAVNAINAQMWILISEAQKQAGPLDFAVNTAAEIAGFGGSAFIGIMAFTYVVAEWVLSLLVVAFPLCCMASMVPVLSDVIRRWAGKTLSVLFLIFFGVVVLQLVLVMEQTNLDRLVASQEAANAAIAALPIYDIPGRLAATSAAMASAVQTLVSMLVVLGFGAVMLYALPAIAYSLGSGIAAPQGVAMLGAALGLQKAANAMLGFLRAHGNPSGMQLSSMPRMPNYQLQMPQQQLPAPGSRAALPPPPPPPIARTRT